MLWLVIADRVGGINDYLALLDLPLSYYKDVITALEGESDAARIQASETRAGQSLGGRS